MPGVFYNYLITNEARWVLQNLHHPLGLQSTNLTRSSRSHKNTWFTPSSFILIIVSSYIDIISNTLLKCIDIYYLKKGKKGKKRAKNRPQIVLKLDLTRLDSDFFLSSTRIRFEFDSNLTRTRLELEFDSNSTRTRHKLGLFSWLELDSDSTRIRPIFSPNSTRIRQTRTFFLVRVMTRIRLELASFGKKTSQLDSIRLNFFSPTRFTPSYVERCSLN